MRKSNLSNFIFIKSLIVVFFISSSAFSADIKRNYLEPSFSIFIGLDFITNYHLRVVELFSKAYERKSSNNEVKIRAIVTPSFSPEYVIGVRLYVVRAEWTNMLKITLHYDRGLGHC